jgi:hypothetical protein
MLTQYYPTALIIIAALFVSTFAHQTLAAKSCDHYKDKIEHYENLRRAGGSMTKMNRWTTRGHELEDALRKCTQANGGSVIQIASGSQTKTTKNSVRKKTEHLALRKSNSDDEQLQQLIQTCNYWIAQSNANSSQDNINFRETACNAVDNYQPESDNPASTSNTIPVRKLKDCIKPNNLIDADVNECIKGDIEPTWKQL